VMERARDVINKLKTSLLAISLLVFAGRFTRA